VKGGWWREKARAMAQMFRPRTWSYLVQGRRALARSRRVPDREILAHATAVIRHPDFASPVVRSVIEPVWRAAFALLKAVVVW
jgi:hypothetical protein